MRATAILLAATLLALPAAAGERSPDGGYLLVDPVLPGVAEGVIVPVTTHVTLSGDVLSFTFLTSDRSAGVEALTVRFTEAGGALAVAAHEIAGGAEGVIDRADLDRAHILLPMLAFLDGAGVAWEAQGFTLTQGATRGRFVAASAEFAREALALTAAHGVSLARLGTCTLRQLAEINLRAGRSPAEEEVLAAARTLGRLALMRGDAARREGADLLGAVIGDLVRSQGATLDGVLAARAGAPGFAAAHAAAIAGHEADIVAAAVHLARAARVLGPLDGEAQAARLCASVLLPD